MTVKELKEILTTANEDADIMILLSASSNAPNFETPSSEIYTAQMHLDDHNECRDIFALIEIE